MIGIFSFLSPRYAQFIYKYTNIFDAEGIPYEVVFWNRENENYNLEDNWISYNREINTFQPFYKKIQGFVEYSFFMFRTIKSRKYDKLIVLTTQTAIPLFPVLLCSFSKRYIYDFRDITYENYSWYKKLVNKLVMNSYFTAISSKGFLDTLESSERFVMSHNTREFEMVPVTHTNSDKIRIVYWGMVRQPDFNCKICDLFAQDDRFELVYHGAGFHKEIVKYCTNKGYKNIKITGAYKLADIEHFVKETDYVLNAYENDKQQKPAMTVKFYDAIRYRIPMLVTADSYMGEIVDKYALGLTVDWNKEQNIDALYSQLKNFDYGQFYKNVDIVYESIQEDDMKFRKCLLEFAK